MALRYNTPVVDPITEQEVGYLRVRYNEQINGQPLNATILGWKNKANFNRNNPSGYGVVGSIVNFQVQVPFEFYDAETGKNSKIIEKYIIRPDAENTSIYKNGEQIAD